MVAACHPPFDDIVRRNWSPAFRRSTTVSGVRRCVVATVIRLRWQNNAVAAVDVTVRRSLPSHGNHFINNMRADRPIATGRALSLDWSRKSRGPSLINIHKSPVTCTTNHGICALPAAITSGSFARGRQARSRIRCFANLRFHISQKVRSARSSERHQSTHR